MAKRCVFPPLWFESENRLDYNNEAMNKYVDLRPKYWSRQCTLLSGRLSLCNLYVRYSPASNNRISEYRTSRCSPHLEQVSPQFQRTRYNSLILRNWRGFKLGNPENMIFNMNRGKRETFLQAWDSAKSAASFCIEGRKL